MESVLPHEPTFTLQPVPQLFSAFFLPLVGLFETIGKRMNGIILESEG
jgi:hypothetical protein